MTERLRTKVSLAELLYQNPNAAPIDFERVCPDVTSQTWSARVTGEARSDNDAYHGGARTQVSAVAKNLP